MSAAQTTVATTWASAISQGFAVEMWWWSPPPFDKAKCPASCPNASNATTDTGLCALLFAATAPTAAEVASNSVAAESDGKGAPAMP